MDLGEFKIPNFKFEYEIEVSQVLQSLGLVLPFDPDGFGLREMVYDHPLCVSSMFHKSLIEVDEKVTELMLLQVVGIRKNRRSGLTLCSSLDMCLIIRRLELLILSYSDNRVIYV